MSAKELLDAATPLPWDTDISPDGRYSWIHHRGTHLTGASSSRDVHINHALIVYAVNRLPDYEAAVEALERLLDRYTMTPVRYREKYDMRARASIDEELAEEDTDRTVVIEKARAVLRRLRDEVTE